MAEQRPRPTALLSPAHRASTGTRRRGGHAERACRPVSALLAELAGRKTPPLDGVGLVRRSRTRRLRSRTRRSRGSRTACRSGRIAGDTANGTRARKRRCFSICRTIPANHEPRTGSCAGGDGVGVEGGARCLSALTWRRPTATARAAQHRAAPRGTKLETPTAVAEPLLERSVDGEVTPPCPGWPNGRSGACRLPTVTRTGSHRASARRIETGAGKLRLADQRLREIIDFAVKRQTTNVCGRIELSSHRNMSPVCGTMTMLSGCLRRSGVVDS